MTPGFLVWPVPKSGNTGQGTSLEENNEVSTGNAELGFVKKIPEWRYLVDQ